MYKHVYYTLIMVYVSDIPVIIVTINIILAFFANFANFFWQNTMLQGIERYLKQAIVDKNASVSSASLVSALVSFASV